MVFLCSDANADREGDRVIPAGIKLDNYLKNPVVLWAHDREAPAIGTAKTWLDERGLWMSPKFSEVNPLGKQIGEQVKAGEIRGVSIGFLPLKSAPNELGGEDFLETELLEITICNVPVHPGALRAKSMSDEIAKQILKAVEALAAKLDKPAEEKPEEKKAEPPAEEKAKADEGKKKPTDESAEKPAEDAAPSTSDEGEDVEKALTDWLTK